MSPRGGIDIFVVLRHRPPCLLYTATRHLRLNKIISSGSLTISVSVFFALFLCGLTSKATSRPSRLPNHRESPRDGERTMAQVLRMAKEIRSLRLLILSASHSGSRTATTDTTLLPRGTRTLLFSSCFSRSFMHTPLPIQYHHRHPHCRRFYTKLRHS
jgi:hypothetical protein